MIASPIRCTRELLRAIWLRKPLVALLDPHVGRAELSATQIRQQIDSNRALWELWGIAAELRAWGMLELPTASEVFEALFPTDGLRPPLEWERITPYQV